MVGVAQICRGVPAQRRRFGVLSQGRRASVSGACVRSRTVCVRAKKDAEIDKERSYKAGSGAKAAALAAALAVAISSGVPDAAEAARSGGRMGGARFRSAPRSAPRARSAPSSRMGGGGLGGGVYVAPPIYGYGGGLGYGGGYYGGGLLSPFTFFAPGMFSFIFNLMVLSFVVSTVMNVISKVQGGNDDDGFDDEDQW